MEIVSRDGSSTKVKPGQTRELGRGHGLTSSDKTISRRHISFFCPPFTDQNQETPPLQFEVLGRNPIYVSRDNEVKLFRRFERGEMGNGDMLCVSAKDPVWYTVREAEDCREAVRGNDLAGKLESDFGFNGVGDLEKDGFDFQDINPVQEFGFLVMGHEFDSYPKTMIKDFKNWNWFLEETGKDSENDDEEWTGESEDEKELINKTKKGQKPKYMTRSKDRGKANKGSSKRSNTAMKGNNRDVDDEDEEEEDESDETLGGFIVDDEKLEEEEADEEDEDEEEEEIDDEFDEDER